MKARTTWLGRRCSHWKRQFGKGGRKKHRAQVGDQLPARRALQLGEWSESGNDELMLMLMLILMFILVLVLVIVIETQVGSYK